MTQCVLSSSSLGMGLVHNIQSSDLLRRHWRTKLKWSRLFCSWGASQGQQIDFRGKFVCCPVDRLLGSQPTPRWRWHCLGSTKDPSLLMEGCGRVQTILFLLTMLICSTSCQFQCHAVNNQSHYQAPSCTVAEWGGGESGTFLHVISMSWHSFKHLSLAAVLPR